MRRKNKHILKKIERFEKLRIKIKDTLEDPLWNIVGYSNSKDMDLSVNHDKYLYGKNK